MNTRDDVSPPRGYGNGEGASAPDAEPAYPPGTVLDMRLRWDCGHLATEHTRAEAAACRNAQFVHSAAAPRLDAGRAALVAQLDDAKSTSPPLSMTVALWNGYLKGITRSRGPTLLLFERDVRALLELHDFAERTHAY